MALGIMARELLIVWAGRHQRGAGEELCAVYRRRLGRALPVRDLAVRARKSGADRARRRAEGEALLAALPRPCWTVALDPAGEMLSSEELARRWSRRQREWPHPVAFVLGSDVGLDPAVLAAARERWSLGPLTLPHELARLVLYEQLYRALSIATGIDYHRGPL
jgi:23S rRNA (pseudouridine1915-N3)-methyltransferase